MQVLHPSQRLGEFLIVRLLGKGGMGQVYEAQQMNPPRPVALKVLAPWLAQDEEALQRFWREAAVPAQLDHPAIVRIISTGKTAEGTAYYVMHLVRGISLADLIRRSREQSKITADVPTALADVLGKGAADPLPAGCAPPGLQAAYRSDRCRFAARFGAVAARALAHAHEQGFLHRDIKPSNLMIDQHEQLYLVDFGLTRALDPGTTATKSGIIRGTPWYMSPEQARGETVDERSDIYSLGVTLYELVTQGEGPFSASRQNSAAVMAQVRAGDWLPLRTFAPDALPELEQLIVRAMQVMPQRRQQSAAALADELERIANQSAPPTLTRSTVVPCVPCRSKPTVWLTASALGLLALAAIDFLWIHAVFQPSEPASLPRKQGEETSPATTLKERFRYERLVGVRSPLLREDIEPIRSHVVLGSGQYLPAPSKELVLHSPPDNTPTVIVLDYVDRSFEFEIELRQAGIGPPNENELGLVFGWHDTIRPSPLAAEALGVRGTLNGNGDPAAVPRFFTVQLDGRPVLNDLHGRVTIGTGQWTERRGARGTIGELLSPLPEGRGLLPLGKPRPDRAGWHKLSIRVEPERITVTLDDGPSEEFDRAWLSKADRGPKSNGLDPYGAVGIWVRNGVGYFRNATMMILPDRR